MSRAEREEQMLDVAEEVFADLGYQGVSMDEIAERCGVSKPMLYEYFGSKNGLLQAVIARARDQLYEVTSAAMAGGADPYDVLSRGMLAYFTFMDDHRRAAAVRLQEPVVLSATAHEIEATRRRQSALIAPILAGFAPEAPETAIDAYAEIIIGGCERLMLWRAGRPEVTAAQAAQYMTDFTWHGLGPYVGVVPAARPSVGQA
jgi:AcrR family transcriptional regulator